MNEKPLYQHVFNLLDYTDEITALLQPDAEDKNSYFMTLLYIEGMLDSYARGFVASKYLGTDFTEDDIFAIRKDLNSRVEALRSTIRSFAQMYNFDDVIIDTNNELYKRWRKKEG